MAEPFVPSPLYVICDVEVCASAGWSAVDFTEACLAGGARLLQVRAKALSGQAFYDLAARISDAGRTAGATVVINDRADVAMACAASGVHVGQDDLPPGAVRALLGPTAVVGWSTHSDEQLRAGCDAPVSYLATGPVFGTATKDTGYTPRGLDAVRRAADVCAPHRLPLVAIGGITLARAAAVIEAGARSVAVISDLLSSGRPESRVRDFLKALS